MADDINCKISLTFAIYAKMCMIDKIYNYKIVFKKVKCDIL